MNGYELLFFTDSKADRPQLTEFLDDNTSGGRGRGRKRAEERWILKRYLEQIDTSNFEPPLTLLQATAGQTPDFIIATHGFHIGIEVTELIPPAVAQSIAADRDPQLQSNGYVGDEPEEICARLLVKRLIDKFAQFQNWTHHSMQRKVLLIYEDTFLPMLRIDRVLALAKVHIKERPNELEVTILHKGFWHDYD